MPEKKPETAPSSSEDTLAGTGARGGDELRNGDAQPAGESPGMPDLLAQMFRGGSGKDRIIREVFTGLFMGPSANPLSQKVTPQHIDKMLENDSQKQRDDHAHRTHRLIASAGVFVLAILFILALANMFRDKEALISHLLTAAFALLTGLLGGFGLGRTSRDT